MNTSIKYRAGTAEMFAEQLDRANGIVRREYHVMSDGKPLYVREICPTASPENRYVIFIHGLTFPSSVDFDMPQEGYSVTKHLASRGIHCCIFDIRGYGKSCKPGYGEPIGMKERARDLSAVYGFIKRKHSTNNISLIGLSNGCNTIVEFIAITEETPESLVFIGPSYLLNDAMMTVMRRARLILFLQTLIGKRDNVYAPLGCRLLRSRLYRGEEKLIDREIFECFLNTSIEITSPGSRCLRAPVLSFPDPKRSWRKWDQTFDAGKISCPLLILRGERDEFCCRRTAETLAENVSAKTVKLKAFRNRKHDMHLYKQHLDYFEEIYEFVAAHGGSSA